MRKAALIVLYIVVVLLIAVPPMFAALLTSVCMNPTGASCRSVTLQDWFAGDLAIIWMPPFALAMLLILVITRLHNSG